MSAFKDLNFEDNFLHSLQELIIKKDPSSIVCDPSIEKCSGGTNTTDTTGLAGTSLSSSSGGIGSSIGCFPTECKHWKNKRKCCTININGQCDYKDCRDLY